MSARRQPVGVSGELRDWAFDIPNISFALVQLQAVCFDRQE